MPRYPQRPWFSPLGMMATSPQSYAAIVFSMGFFVAYPFRYTISEWYERQSLTPNTFLRSKAVAYYRELERMHRRQAMLNNPMWMSDLDGHQQSATMGADALKAGVTDNEYQYWHAHQRDALRAEKLVQEIKELQSKITAKA